MVTQLSWINDKLIFNGKETRNISFSMLQKVYAGDEQKHHLTFRCVTMVILAADTKK